LTAKKALGFLDEEFVVVEQLEDQLNLLRVLLPSGAISENIIKNMRTNGRIKGWRMSFIKA
jgi:hypothetical protein